MVFDQHLGPKALRTEKNSTLKYLNFKLDYIIYFMSNLDEPISNLLIKSIFGRVLINL